MNLDKTFRTVIASKEGNNGGKDLIIYGRLQDEIGYSVVFLLGELNLRISKRQPNIVAHNILEWDIKLCEQ